MDLKFSALSESTESWIVFPSPFSLPGQFPQEDGCTQCDLHIPNIKYKQIWWLRNLLLTDDKLHLHQE